MKENFLRSLISVFSKNEEKITALRHADEEAPGTQSVWLG